MVVNPFAQPDMHRSPNTLGYARTFIIPYHGFTRTKRRA